MMKYVLGFAFSPDLKQVILIQKRKPEFQHGKFNGIGGKIEDGEDPWQAMIREFAEETGVYASVPWQGFITMNSESWMCECFFIVLNSSEFELCTTQEGEFVVKSDIDDLPANCMRNLHWLIPMALNWDKSLTSVEYH